MMKVKNDDKENDDDGRKTSDYYPEDLRASARRVLPHLLLRKNV